MIIGIGSDIVDIRRIESSLKEFGARFENRIFTEGEQQLATLRKDAGEQIVAATYAKRFAAKEACTKALGIASSGGVSWRDMEVVSLPGGMPTMALHGAAKAKLDAMIPPGMQASIHVSLSDDYPYAQAYLIISAEPV